MATRQHATGAPSPTRTAVYCRVSSSGQEDNSSLETQEAACRAYAESRGWAVVAVYREVHTGAELFERPRLTELREAMRRREFDVLLVHALDRLSRKQTHQGLILSEAEHGGVAWDSVTEDVDDSPQGQILRAVIGGMAEMERLKLAERTVRGRLARARAGKPIPGWKAPYGYRWADAEKTRLLEDPDAAHVVRRIFREAAAGTSTRRIVLGLAADSIPSPSGNPRWPHSTIHDMLSLPTYMGEMRAFRTRVERTRGGWAYTLRPESEQIALPASVAPALVERVMWDAVQARLARNKAESSRRNPEPEATLLRAGFARCGYCGRYLRATRTLRGWTYSCQARQRGGDCPSFGIKAEMLDRAVWARVEAILTQPAIIAAEVKRQRQNNPAADDLIALDRRLAALGQRQQRVARAVAALDDDEAASPLLVELKALAKQRQQLSSERAEIAALRAGWEADWERLVNLAAWCDRVAGNLPTLSYAERRDVLTALGVQAQVWRSDHQPRFAIVMRPDDIVPTTT